MIKAEWLKIFKTRKMLVSIVAVLFIPVMYAGMFLWAFWDPYAGMSDLPVAIVNEDSGAEMDGVKLDLGETLVEKLVDSKQFNFIEVSKEEAEKGLDGRDYYMILEIPENFSEHATTLLDEKPSKLVMNYIPNEGLNFLSSQIGETAMDRIRAEVNTQVSTTYAEKLFDSIATLGDGFTEAADGSLQLDEGAQKVANGAKDLKGYLEQLANSTIQLSDGTDKLVAGAQQAVEGASNLQQGVTQYTEGVAQVKEGLSTLNEKQSQIIDGTASIAQNAGALNSAATELTAGSAQVEAGINALTQQLQSALATMPEEQATALNQTLAQLQAGSASVHNGLSSLSAGTEKLQAGANQVNGGATQIAAGQAKVLAGANSLTAKSSELIQGSQQLVSGLNELASGTSTLNEGTTTLASKSGELAEGSATLAEGSTELADGTATLSGKLEEASEKASEVKANDDTYDMVGNPVEVEKDSVNPVANYGTGFAPYFISLGLFVGALLISIVFPLVEPAIRPKNGASWFTSKVVVLAVVGLIQSLLTVAVVKWGLGLEVQNMGYFILTALLTSYAFLALVQMLVSILGDPGRFVAIVVLILQLTTSAGTFPLELIPGPLQVFNTLLPMTYSVQAFKASISTGDMSFLFQNYAVLLGYMVVFLAITFGYFMLVHKKRYSKVAEEN
ncbi:membrane protein [Lysinibacillus contaminans]|uniref:Membrane protein n=1 Tax=Lysinibacillus contaminans TaxID=1293441 RepID=A0ABR5K751_9BACI|nr:YhgE/Pip domain-containing protein [Lysinibacillus contaminans]KOS71639.1 membrane protein [Lysinibacillus contaminans]